MPSQTVAVTVVLLVGNTVMVTESVVVHNGEKLMSSKAKSFPCILVFWFNIHNWAVVLFPEFHVAKNSSQVQSVAVEPNKEPIGMLFIDICKIAGLSG